MPSVHSQIVFPSDGETCPKGIPSPAKMEKGKAIAHSLGVNKGKEVDLDEEYFEEGEDDMVGTISIIFSEYLEEYEGDPEEDYDEESEEAFSFIQFEDEPGFFLRPTEKQKSHLRPLHITTTLSGIKVSKVLIDGGAAISLLPETLNSYNCEGCYLSSEGLTVKLGYPQLNVSPTEYGVEVGNSKVEFKRSDKSWVRRASLIHAAGTDTSSSWITRFKTEIRLANVALVGVVLDQEEFEIQPVEGDWRIPGEFLRLWIEENLQQQRLFKWQITGFSQKYDCT
ncbi:hypothetical protein Ahy_B02g060682 [Arachis hypogaea]|uniref:Uncharacterized protein n=1 Tax=Arachis hypogaea TaxID=3818 RepID=A0A445AJ33_ARAHY|nr:hypothetical protein Ahy_B02g060682 [Arachis hypogaea]